MKLGAGKVKLVAAELGLLAKQVVGRKGHSCICIISSLNNDPIKTMSNRDIDIWTPSHPNVDTVTWLLSCGGKYPVNQHHLSSVLAAAGFHYRLIHEAIMVLNDNLEPTVPNLLKKLIPSVGKKCNPADIRRYRRLMNTRKISLSKTRRPQWNIIAFSNTRLERLGRNLVCCFPQLRSEIVGVVEDKTLGVTEDDSLPSTLGRFDPSLRWR
mmetsp:Transcript_3904/g.5356  ORF Transcript_3904/g.5356 Transcript_3904/m.5356 type:complete len:211 (-) Transcript_3904:121-753(-)